MARGVWGGESDNGRSRIAADASIGPPTKTRLVTFGNHSESAYLDPWESIYTHWANHSSQTHFLGQVLFHYLWL